MQQQRSLLDTHLHTMSMRGKVWHRLHKCTCKPIMNNCLLSRQCADVQRMKMIFNDPWNTTGRSTHLGNPSNRAQYSTTQRCCQLSHQMPFALHTWQRHTGALFSTPQVGLCASHTNKQQLLVENHLRAVRLEFIYDQNSILSLSCFNAAVLNRLYTFGDAVFPSTSQQSTLCIHQSGCRPEHYMLCSTLVAVGPDPTQTWC